MAFKACELGGRPNGTEMAADDEEQNGQGCRLPHARESLPPTRYSWEVEEGADAGLVIGPDLEVKDVGDMCHVWRICVAQATLQPTQRVSKAGIESTAGPY